MGIGIRRVGFWRRAAAMGVDLLLVFILWAVLHTMADDSDLGPAGRVSQAGDGLLFNASALVCTASELAGLSLGKLLLGIRIAGIDGSKPSTWMLQVRWTAKWFFAIVGFWAYLLAQSPLLWLGGITQCIVMIGCIQALGEACLTWHDEWARTAVVRRRDLYPRIRKPPKTQI
jgi:uncharacterized RDD family membrane protein YckC